MGRTVYPIIVAVRRVQRQLVAKTEIQLSQHMVLPLLLLSANEEHSDVCRLLLYLLPGFSLFISNRECF